MICFIISWLSYGSGPDFFAQDDFQPFNILKIYAFVSSDSCHSLSFCGVLCSISFGFLSGHHVSFSLAYNFYLMRKLLAADQYEDKIVTWSYPFWLSLQIKIEKASWNHFYGCNVLFIKNIFWLKTC